MKLKTHLMNSILIVLLDIKNNENIDININININEYNHECNKNFYVSPFIGMKAKYKFKNLIPQKKMSIVIDLFDKNNKKILTATQYGDKLSFQFFYFIKTIIF